MNDVCVLRCELGVHGAERVGSGEWSWGYNLILVEKVMYEEGSSGTDIGCWEAEELVSEVGYCVDVHGEVHFRGIEEEVVDCERRLKCWGMADWTESS